MPLAFPTGGLFHCFLERASRVPGGSCRVSPGQRKSPATGAGLKKGKSETLYAARVADSSSASGAGAHIYAAKTGVGSVLSPREMTIPIGSGEFVSLRSFFITLTW